MFCCCCKQTTVQVENEDESISAPLVTKSTVADSERQHQQHDYQTMSSSSKLQPSTATTENHSENHVSSDEISHKQPRTEISEQTKAASNQPETTIESVPNAKNHEETKLIGDDQIRADQLPGIRRESPLHGAEVSQPSVNEDKKLSSAVGYANLALERNFDSDANTSQDHVKADDILETVNNAGVIPLVVSDGQETIVNDFNTTTAEVFPSINNATADVQLRSEANGADNEVSKLGTDSPSENIPKPFVDASAALAEDIPKPQNESSIEEATKSHTDTSAEDILRLQHEKSAEYVSELLTSAVETIEAQNETLSEDVPKQNLEESADDVLKPRRSIEDISKQHIDTSAAQNETREENLPKLIILTEEISRGQKETLSEDVPHFEVVADDFPKPLNETSIEDISIPHIAPSAEGTLTSQRETSTEDVPKMLNSAEETPTAQNETLSEEVPRQHLEGPADDVSKPQSSTEDVSKPQCDASPDGILTSQQETSVEDVPNLLKSAKDTTRAQSETLSDDAPKPNLEKTADDGPIPPNETSIEDATQTHAELSSEQMPKSQERQSMEEAEQIAKSITEELISQTDMSGDEIRQPQSVTYPEDVRERPL